MNDIIYLGDYYYKDKIQGERLKKDVSYGESHIIYPLHATNISHCISKTCQLFQCVENGIKIPFTEESMKKMEIGKSYHKLIQQDVDWKVSEFYDDTLGWYPPFHCTNPDHRHWINSWEFIENQMVHYIQISDDKHIKISGTLDEFKIDSKGFYIEDIKVTFGFKWLKGARENHKIQLHVYMWLMEQSEGLHTYQIPDNFPLSLLSKEFYYFKMEEYWNYHKDSGNMNQYKTFEEYIEGETREEDMCFWDLDFTKCRRGKVKYVDAFNPMRVKIYNVPYRKKYFDFIYEQIDKYKHFILDGELPEPNYDYLASWECDPKYCPFSRNSPLGKDCPFSRYEKNDK